MARVNLPGKPVNNSPDRLHPVRAPGQRSKDPLRILVVRRLLAVDVACQRSRVVPRSGHLARGQPVGVELEFPPHLQKAQRNGDRLALLDSVACPTAHIDERQGRGVS